MTFLHGDFFMKKNRTSHKKKAWVIFLGCAVLLAGLLGRMIYLMGFRSDYYYEKAEDLHEREREIKAARGRSLIRQEIFLQITGRYATISVIHSQIEEPEKVIRLLTEQLGMEEEEVQRKVEKVSSIERIQTNVDKETGDIIRRAGLAGVKVDEDYKRYYPHGSLASKVLGFTGGDNQGIIGLEVEYEEVLQARRGKFLQQQTPEYRDRRHRREQTGAGIRK